MNNLERSGSKIFGVNLSLIMIAIITVLSIMFYNYMTLFESRIGDL